MEEPSGDKSCYNAALRMLCNRAYPSCKLGSKLIQKGFAKDCVDDVISRLVEQGYLRDDLYTIGRIRSLLDKNFSPYYIISKLKEENIGLDMPLITNVMDEMGVTVSQQIDRLIDKKLRALGCGSKGASKARDKILRHLLSRGHSYSESSLGVSRKIPVDLD